jgi:hypothetical protein
MLSSNLTLSFIQQGDKEALAPAQIQDSKLILDALGHYHALNYEVTCGDGHEVANKANQIRDVVDNLGAVHDVEAAYLLL